jgi:Animal haem peroxidase
MLGDPPGGGETMRLTLVQRLVILLGSALERIRPWHELPLPLGLLCLIGIRTRLRRHNLYDPAPPDGTGPRPPVGGVGFPFGRNQPLWKAPSTAPAEIHDPNPREVSRRLLARDGEMTPAPFFNLLGAAWLQFQVHDWLSHGQGTRARQITIRLAQDDDWPQDVRIDGDMAITGTDRSGLGGAPGGPPVFVNTETHWWDGSQVYGSTADRARMVREGAGGRLRLEQDGSLPLDEIHGVELAGVNANWWMGLSLLHTLFAHEHNAICAMLADRHHDWDDERIFQVARRVNAAVMAKIHTLEWTLAILPHPTVRAAMRGNWYGFLGPWGSRLLRRFTRWDFLIGIPGSRRDDHGVPHSLTEEFVGVYRMHPLIPDEFRMVSPADGREIGTRTMLQLTGTETLRGGEGLGREELMASFGVGRAGALALRNYPESLRRLPRGPSATFAGDKLIDLATIDIVRDRERAVPRYNDFRRMLRLAPVAGFEELTGGDPATTEELRRLYGDDVDRVDLMVGLYAEPAPKRFGFCETAFRIFVLMASRRLKSDPLFTDDWGPGVYTREGMRWIEDATMQGVIARHMPGLAHLVADVKNAFEPWDRPCNRVSGRTHPFPPAECAP